jgi:hypothetical protein
MAKKIPTEPSIPDGVEPWRQAKALALRGRRANLVMAAKRDLDKDKIIDAERTIDYIHEIDGEIRGLEESS